jgi:hypothetical protein
LFDVSWKFGETTLARRSKCGARRAALVAVRVVVSVMAHS